MARPSRSRCRRWTEHQVTRGANRTGGTRIGRPTAIALGFAALVLTGLAGAQDQNRAPNPGFEQAERERPAGWSAGVIAGDPQRVTLEYVDSPRGGRCVSIESADAEARVGWSVVRRIPVLPGQPIRVRMMVRLEDLRPGPGGGEGFVITCHFYDRTSYLTWAPSAGEIGSADWHPVEFECRPPEGAQAVVLGFRLSRCTGRALVDDVELYAGAPAEVPGAERYGLQPGDPGVTLSVAMLTGAAADSDATRQVIDLLNREGIAVVAEDPASAARFPANAEALRTFDCVMIGAINPETGAGLLSAELTVAEDPITREQVRCNRLLNAAEDALGEVRAVRATEFGSLWVGARGYALFAFEDRRVTVEGLEGDGWQVGFPDPRGGSLTLAGGRAAGHMLAGELALITRR